MFQDNMLVYLLCYFDNLPYIYCYLGDIHLYQLCYMSDILVYLLCYLYDVPINKLC